MAQRNYGAEISALSKRASGWGILLAQYQMSYPFSEAHHTAIDRLLNQNIKDGEKALELVYLTLAEVAKEDSRQGNILVRTIEDTIVVGRENAITLLDRCAQEPYDKKYGKLKKAILEVLTRYRSGEFKPQKSQAFTEGDDIQITERLERRLQELTRNWKD